MDEWNEAMFGEGFEEEEEFEPSKEQLFFLIDASAPMLEPCEAGDDGDEGDQNFKGCTWLEAGVKVAVHIMRQKIICGARDEAAVLLYNVATTSSTKELGEFSGCYLLQGLEAPDAEAVQRLEAFSVEAFNRKIRSGDDPGPSLISAFWMAKALMTRDKHAKATRRILVFTRNQEPFPRFDKGRDPSRSWRTLQAHLRDLRERGAGVELYPMVPPGQPFVLEAFWRGVLQYLRVGAGDEGEEEEAQQVFRLRDLFTVVRSRAHRKRSVGSLRWALGPGLDLAVKLYQLLQPQKPPGLLHISGRTGHEVKASTEPVDFFTGIMLSPVEIRQYFFKKAERYPRVYMSREEIATIKGQGQAGMTLLGFKPASCLEEHHNIRNSTFVYPDDKARPGSATFFISLWQAMRQSNTMAVCMLAATRARSPALVALLPQEEVLYDDGSGAQAVPHGFQLIYLPFHDDIRAPEAHPDFVGPVRHAPSEAQIAAAEVLLAELQLTEFDCRTVLNPALQRHYEVLEALALNEAPPPLEDSAVGDPTLPAWEEEAEEGMEEEEAEAVAARMAAILGFKDAVGLGEEEAKKGAPKKRPAQEPLGGNELAALGVEAKAAAGTLKSLTVDQLKAWLRAHGGGVGGKKDELIARVHNKLGL